MREIVNWMKDFILPLIEVYRSKTCLNDVKSIEYRSRERTRDAQEDVVKAVKSIIPDITNIVLSSVICNSILI